MPNVHLELKTLGYRDEGCHTTIRWSHPDFNDLNPYFPMFTVSGPETGTKDFSLPDAKSEFEIQTEGGETTGYVLTISIDEKKAFEATHNTTPKSGTTSEAFGVCGVARSAGPDKYGEQNFRIDLRGTTTGAV